MFWASEVMPKLRRNVLFMEVKFGLSFGSVIFAILEISNYHSLKAIIGFPNLIWINTIATIKNPGKIIVDKPTNL